MVLGRVADMCSSIISYLERFSRFPGITRVDAATVEGFGSSSEVVVIAYISSEDAASTARFEALAKTLHPEVVFGMIDDADLARAENVTAPMVVVHNNSTDERCVLPLTADGEDMKASIRRAALPLVVELYPEIHDDLLDVSHFISYNSFLHFTTPDHIYLTYNATI